MVDLTKGPAKWLENPAVESRLSDALGGWMSADEFMAQLLISFQDPQIKLTSAKSQYEAAHTCAALSLLPTLNQVALIPRQMTISKQGEPGKKEWQVHVMPQWQGYKALMERNPEILEVQAYLVHKMDDYRIIGKRIDHNPDPFQEGREFNTLDDVKGGYLVITYTDRTRPDKYFPVSKMYIQKARACAQTDKLWNAWFEQMCLKTVYRCAFARRAVSIDPAVTKKINAVTQTDDKLLGNDPSRVIDATVIQPKLSVAEKANARLTSFGKQVSQEQKTAAATTPTEPVDSSEPADDEKAMTEAQQFVENARQDAIENATNEFAAAHDMGEIDELYNRLKADGVDGNVLNDLYNEASERIGGEE